MVEMSRLFSADEIIANVVKLVKQGQTNRQIFDRLQEVFPGVKHRTTWAIICAAHYDIEQE